MSVKRVLVFSTDDHLYPAGGAEQAFGNISARIPEITFDLICAKLRPGVKSYEQVGNVNIYRLGFGIPKLDGFIVALFGQVKAKALMKEQKYDLLWSIMASYGAFAAVRVKRQSGLPLLLTLQEGDSFDYIYRKVKWVRRQFNEIFRTADGVQAISNYLLNWAKDMGYQGENGRVIPNGVAVEMFSRNFTPEEKYQTRQSFGFSNHATVLFTSSRLEPKNGVGDAIEALAKLPPEVCFVICGSGSLEVALRQKVTALKLDDRVRFMGFVDPSELPRLMQASDIFIRPSLSEGLGNAFLEAMAAGIITVGTNVGGIPDFLVDGQNGFMVKPEDPDSIVATINKIRKLAGSEKEIILTEAQTMVLTKYNWEVVVESMRDLLAALTKPTA